MRKTYTFMILLPLLCAVLAATTWAAGEASLDAGVVQELTDSPDGVAIRLGDDNSFQIFSTGTGSYDFDDADDILAAQNEATQKAKANLAKFLNESLHNEDQFNSASAKVKKLSQQDGKTTTTVDRVSARTMLTSIRNSAAALLRGVVVLASSKIPGTGSSGMVRVTVGVSSKTLEAAGKLAAGIAAPAPASDPAAGAASGDGAAAATGAGSGGARPAEGWIECVGTGKDRAGAVNAALVEGVGQVYGTALQNDTKLQERMKKFRLNNDLRRESFRNQESNTLTKTSGFVREYRIVNVRDLGDGRIEAVVHALIVNPRAGGVVALMLWKPTMAQENLTRDFELGPGRRLSGSEVTTLAERTLNRAFINMNRFLVLDVEDTAIAAGQQALAGKLVEAGLAPASELLKAGQMLTADYVLTTLIEELKYSRKLGLNKATGKFEPLYAMSLRMGYKLTDVTTGRPVLSDVLTVRLDHKEISDLLAEDEQSDLLQTLMDKAAQTLSDAITRQNQ